MSCYLFFRWAISRNPVVLNEERKEWRAARATVPNYQLNRSRTGRFIHFQISWEHLPSAQLYYSESTLRTKLPFQKLTEWGRWVSRLAGHLKGHLHGAGIEGFLVSQHYFHFNLILLQCYSSLTSNSLSSNFSFISRIRKLPVSLAHNTLHFKAFIAVATI